MNTSVQDAVNLGWKLGRVLRGEKSDAFLDTYDEERRPVGRAILQSTDRLFSWNTWTNPVWMWLRNLLAPWILPHVFSSPERRSRAFRFLSQLSLHYRGSSIVGTAKGFDGPIHGGDRLFNGHVRTADGQETSLQEVCVGPGHHLVLFSGLSQDAVSAAEVARVEGAVGEVFRGRLSVHTVAEKPEVGDMRADLIDSEGRLHQDYGLEKGGFVFVRPDAYVAYIGGRNCIDEFLAWLKEA